MQELTEFQMKKVKWTEAKSRMNIMTMIITIIMNAKMDFRLLS